MLFTFACVVIAWVPFRSANFGVTQAMLSGMAGLNGVSVSPRFAYLGELSHLFAITGWMPLTGMIILDGVIWLTAGFLIVWALPNTQQWLANFSPAWDNVTSLSRLAWKPTRLKAIMVGALLGFSLLCLNRVSEFLYFQF